MHGINTCLNAEIKIKKHGFLFTGTDPSTDLRGVGLLGILQLLFLTMGLGNTELVNDIYRLSRDKVQVCRHSSGHDLFKYLAFKLWFPRSLETSNEILTFPTVYWADKKHKFC